MDRPAALGKAWDEPQSAFIGNPCPFIEPIPEWRGVRTKTHTYVRAIDGPWLLYDNLADPYQMTNLVGSPEHADLEGGLEAELRRWLGRLGDDFAPRELLWERFSYAVDNHFQMPYDNTVGSFET